MYPHGTRSAYNHDGCRCDACKEAARRYQREAHERRRLRLLDDPTLAPHGIRSTYDNWGCRCAPCTEAKTADARLRNERYKAIWGVARDRTRRTPAPPCSVEGCERSAFARGMCKMHWQRFNRSGDPGPVVSLKDPDWRFFSSIVVDPSSGCWNWLQYRSPQGYGRFTFGGKILVAHRWSYERFVGPIPDGLQLDHLCRNTSCVNPDHLEPVTNAENQRRAAEARTHCKHGHEFTPENTSRSGGRRTCRECARVYKREWAARKREAS